MRKFGKATLIVIAAVAAGISGMSGCGKKDVRNEVVATADGEEIRVRELREFLGAPGGVEALPGIPLEKKREGLDRLVAGRLLAVDARKKGLDNTAEYRAILAQNEPGVLLNALLRKELEGKSGPDEKEVQAEAAKLKEGNKGMPDNEAMARASRAASERWIRKIEEDLVNAARKEIQPAVDRAMLDRVLRGDAVGDNAVLATAGAEKLSLGDVRKILKAVAGEGPHANEDLTRNAAAMNSVVNREITGKALNAYAKSRNIAGSDAYKTTRLDMERTVLISLAAERAVPKELQVTDQEIEATYKEHSAMFAREGKRIPLAQVKEQIRGFLMNGKRRKALDDYVAELKKKAKITVNEGLLPKV